MDNMATLDKMFAQIAKVAKSDVFKNSLASMEKAAEISKGIRKLESEASDRNNEAQQKMLKGFNKNLERKYYSK